MNSLTRSAWRRTSSLKSERMRRVVSVPTTSAKPSRMTSVRSAEGTARRQRIESRWSGRGRGRGRPGPRLSAENVARAADRVEESWLATGFELPAEIGHEHLDGVGHRERVVPPDLVEQALAGDDDPLVAHQVLQELELALGQVDRALAAPHLVGVGVEREVPDRERPRPAGRPPAQQRAHAREQLLALERLDEVVVGA